MNIINKIWFIPLIAGVSFSLVSFASDPAPSTRELLNIMIYKIKHLRGVKFDLSSKERLTGGKFSDYHSRVKIQTSPFKLYTLIPGSGQEVLYVEGWNGNDAYVNPNGFPYINLNLDPQNSLMRDGQHHSILEMGFSYFIDLLEKTRNKQSELFYKVSSVKGPVNFLNRECHVLEIDNVTFKYTEYICKEKETVLSIARENLVGEYMILQKNPGIGLLDELGCGTKIKIPTTYGRKINVYIDKQTITPLYIKVWDDEGIYEEYTFDKVQLNPIFASDEFTTDFKGYGF